MEEKTTKKENKTFNQIKLWVLYVLIKKLNEYQIILILIITKKLKQKSQQMMVQI